MKQAEELACENAMPRKRLCWANGKAKIFLRQFTGFYVPVPSGVNCERVLVMWNSVFKRDARWDEYGVWANMFKQFAQDPDMAAVMLDRISARAHIRAAGGSINGDACKNSA